MRPYELHQCAAECVRDVDDQPVFVAAEVEDHPVIADEIHGRAKLPLNIVRIAPETLARHGEPRANGTLGLRMTFPKLLQRPSGDHLHVRIYHVTNLVTTGCPQNQRGVKKERGGRGQEGSQMPRCAVRR